MWQSKKSISMDVYKAPSLDGFEAIVFRENLETIGDDVWGVVNWAFQTREIDTHLAKTLIVLIPKVSFPTRIEDLRHINLCNVIFKLITNVMVLQFWHFLDKIIGI